MDGNRFCKDCRWFHPSEDWLRMKRQGYDVTDQHLEYGTCSNPKYSREPEVDLITGAPKPPTTAYASVNRGFRSLCGKEGEGWEPNGSAIKDVSSGIYEVEPLMIEGKVEKKQWWKRVL